MKKVLFAVSTGILFLVSGCSENSQKDASKSAPAVVQASVVQTSAPAEPAAALPVPSVAQANQHAWQSENVKDKLGNAVALKGTSLDGKYDLVILQRGRYPFVSFARHARWESVPSKSTQGKLMYLRVKFEDGQEKRIEWDELGFATENPYSVLWSYPVKSDAPIGPAPAGHEVASIGGDQLLIEEMMKHKTMLLELEPGVTAQFDMSGLTDQLEKVRAPKSPPVLEAVQTAQ